MNYLLDTHILIWLLISDEKLSTKVKKILLDSSSEINVSTISLWEISLKYRIGKLELEGKSPDEIPEAVKNLGFRILDLDAAEASTFHKIPKIKNKDPFDLMLAWQTICGGYTLLSKDKGFDDYKKDGLKRVW